MTRFALDDATLARLRNAAESAAAVGAADDPIVLTDHRGRPLFTLTAPPPAESSPPPVLVPADALNPPSENDPSGLLGLEKFLRGLPEDPYAEFEMGISSADGVRAAREAIERGDPPRTATQIIAELEAAEAKSGADGRGRSA